MLYGNGLVLHSMHKFFIIYYYYFHLFKVDDIAKILHAQKIYIKLSNTRI